MVTVGSLCTGYGGIELGLQLAGESVDLRWYAETEPQPAALLADLHPGVPNLGDITQVDWPAIGRVDLIAGGIPCQPTSAAGQRLGAADPRWLWPAARACLTALRPARFLLENVRGLVSHDKGKLFDDIIADLGALGYDVRWLTLGACAVGLAHHRHRVFLLAEMAAHDAGGCVATRLPVVECGATRGTSSLPTPNASDASGGRQTGRDRLNGKGRIVRGGQAYGVPLATAISLLPTPRATDGVNGGPPDSGRRGDLALPSAVQPERWGRFAEAIARHAEALGVAPPEPTEPNRNGAPRLRPELVEWLMGVPAGHVTTMLDRKAALKALGNGVVPQQLALAWLHLTGAATVNYGPTDNASTSNRGERMATTSEEARSIQQRLDDNRRTVLAVLRSHLESEPPSTLHEALGGALLALVALWREDAEALETSTKRGAKQKREGLRWAAEELAGFAGGLTKVEPKAIDAPRELVPTLASALADAAASALDAPMGTVIEVGGAASQLPLPLPEEALPVQPIIPAQYSPPAFVAPVIVAPAPVARPRLTWEQFNAAISAIDPRDHVSFSMITELAECGMAHALGRIARHGTADGIVLPEVPAWWNVGGTAFHTAVETIERTMMTSSVGMPNFNAEAAWASHFAAAIAEAEKESGHPRELWRSADKGKENYDWWRVQGPVMLSRYMAHWAPKREQGWRIYTLADGCPGIELKLTLPAAGVAFECVIDQVWVRPDQVLFIDDLKSGKSLPASTFQLGAYAHALNAELVRASLLATGNESWPLPIAGAFYRTREGSHDKECENLLERHPLAEIATRAAAAMAMSEARAYLPRVSDFGGGCSSCAHKLACPARAGDDA